MPENTELLNPHLLGRRLQELRKARGLSQQDVADLLGVARTTIVAVEKGQRLFQPAEITQLCNQWNISVSDFVRPREVVPQFIPQLRTAASRSGSGIDEKDIRESAEALRRLCENYLELETLCSSPLPLNYPQLYQVEGIPIEQAAEDVARAERNRLGLGDGPILNLRELLESRVGLRIFYLPLPSRVAGMFVYDEKLGGCIGINIRQPEERRRWSLAHEYWHFLHDRYRADVCAMPFQRRVGSHERLADFFAQHLLMPTTALRRDFYSLKNAKKNNKILPDLVRLADSYGVGFQALILRLEDLHLLQAETWDYLKRSGFKVRDMQAEMNLIRSTDADVKLPLRYQYLAVEALERGDISEGQFAQFLDMDRVSARKVTQKLSRQEVVGEEGMGELTLDFSDDLSQLVIGAS